MNRLPFDSALLDYREQAEALVAGWRSGDPDAQEIVRHNLPRFLDDRVPWLPRELSEEDMRRDPFDLSDARLALARWYGIADWKNLADWVEAVGQGGSRVRRFESGVEAVITGDTNTLGRLLDDDPDLVRARSTRITPHDPPAHRATLLHHVAANGVEDHRQITPPNAVEVATMLLGRGSEVDALADMYGGGLTTMSLLVSSAHPAKTGVQVPLIEVLLDFGASIEGRGSGNWTSPLATALAFGYLDAAEALVRRGARVKSLAVAAGLGQSETVARLLDGATGEDRHRALALSAQHGHADVVRLLLDAGEDPNRYNPEGNHSHSTPMHQAALGGHLDVVRLLIERGARLDISDTVWQATPLGWAEYGGQTDAAEYLRTRA